MDRKILNGNSVLIHNTIREFYLHLFDRLGAKDYAVKHFPTLIHRHQTANGYHNEKHLLHTLIEFHEAQKEAEPEMEEPEAVELALFHHDEDYRPGAKDNELRAAKYLRKECKEAGLSQLLKDTGVRLIYATNHFILPDRKFTVDEQYIRDIDLAIFGQSSEMFDRYERGIRQEYSFCDDATYRQGRVIALQTFTNKPRIYLTDYFYDRYEKTAKRNLDHAIKTLSNGR